MKRTPRPLIAAILAFGTALPLAAAAQQTPPPSPAPHVWRQHHPHGMMRAFQGVGLSSAQRSQIHAALVQFHTAHPKGSPPDRQARKALHQQIMGVLTPAQRASVRANLARMRAERRARRGAAPGGARSNGVFPPDPTPTPA